MLTFLMMIAVGASAPAATHLSAAEPRTLQCTAMNTREGKDRKCNIKMPKGTTLRGCDAVEMAAGHCALNTRVVAWTSAENGARCKLSRKKTDWKKRVAIKVDKGTKPGAGRCTLFVSVQ